LVVNRRAPKYASQPGQRNCCATIIVRRDRQPFNSAQFLRDAMQITSQLAITVTSVAVLGR
jgi:hypothetical protein